MNEFLNALRTTYLDMSPYLLLGLFFAGLLHILFKKETITRHLGGQRFSSVVKASALGVPLPLCSCGVIPTALHLRKSGASRGATVSFLISTPQTGIDSMLATYGMMGPVFAIFRPIAAFVMGICGGVTSNLMQKEPIKMKEMADCSCDSSCSTTETPATTVWGKLKKGLRYAFVEFLDDISIQLLVGFILAALITWLVPDTFFEKFIGNDLLGMVVIILIGIPLYVCATASIPIAVSLMMKGLSPGGAFVFLAVGPATNAATIFMIANAMGRKTAILYVTSITVLSIVFGIVFNTLLDVTELRSSVIMEHEHGTPL